MLLTINLQINLTIDPSYSYYMRQAPEVTTKWSRRHFPLIMLVFNCLHFAHKGKEHNEQKDLTLLVKRLSSYPKKRN